MKIIFSRKGFDSAAGRAPSPIVDGRPISLPSPTSRRSATTYETIGLGSIVERVTRGRIHAEAYCHEDPAFHDGRWAFGQTGAAQSHLKAQGVTVGDVFVFFGLFAGDGGRDRHHRIFGSLVIEEVRLLGSQPRDDQQPQGFPRRHPHLIGDWNDNNTLYLGPGSRAGSAHDGLRLSKPGGQVSCWMVPAWLPSVGLSYHQKPERWAREGELQLVGRGQEFVADIGDRPEPRAWLQGIVELMEPR